MTSQILRTILEYMHPYPEHSLGAAAACIAIWILLRWFRASRQRPRTTQLRGPPSESFLYGVGKHILEAEDQGAVYEAWAKEYGPAYMVPSTLGSRRIILCDPKAVAHYHSKESWTYIKTPFVRKGLAVVMEFGKGMIWAIGETHKRQRKSLSPAFSIAAIRRLTPIFYDSAYKAKAAWDVLIEADEDTAIIEVQSWMNHISLDIIGLAGFSYNFGTLEGRHTCVTDVFDTLSSSFPSTVFDNVMDLLGLIFPLLAQVPTPRMRLFQKLSTLMGDISDVLLARTRKEMEAGVDMENEERSIIGLLMKRANADAELHLTKDEIVGQMKQLLLAGYETSSITLTWALLELSRNPDIQTKLRNELLEHGTDPTYDQLANGLPYLDAVVHETLRLHPAGIELTRVAIEDDVIPLSEPVHTKSGELASSLMISKGTHLSVSVDCMNRSAAIWGKDAKVFQPSRWLQDTQGQTGIPFKAKEIQGHRHLLTFLDGPRACLGKNFALTELKVVLAVLVKSFVFELRDGINSKIEFGQGVLRRPTIAGEVGCKLPLRVKAYVS